MSDIFPHISRINSYFIVSLFPQNLKNFFCFFCPCPPYYSFQRTSSPISQWYRAIFASSVSFFPEMTNDVESWDTYKSGITQCFSHRCEIIHQEENHRRSNQEDDTPNNLHRHCFEICLVLLRHFSSYFFVFSKFSFHSEILNYLNTFTSC